MPWDVLARVFGQHPPATGIDIPGIGDLQFELQQRNDFWISDPIRSGHIFEAHILEVLRTLIARGDTFLDVGANIGWFTVIGSRLVGPDGRVVAVEPESGNVRLLKRNVRLNGCRNVRVFPCAAGATRATGRLDLSGDNQGDHRLDVLTTRGATVSVPVRPLDMLVKSGTVDVAKFDTQGSEAAALRGMTRLLDANPRIRLLLEFWPYGLSQCGASVEELLSLLSLRRSSFWLLRAGQVPEPVTRDQILSASRSEFAVHTQGHADIVALAEDDREAHAGLVRLSRPS